MNWGFIIVNSLTKGIGIVFMIGAWEVANVIDYSVIREGMTWLSAILIPVFLAYFGIRIMFWDSHKSIKSLKYSVMVIK